MRNLPLMKSSAGKTYRRGITCGICNATMLWSVWISAFENRVGKSNTVTRISVYAGVHFHYNPLQIKTLPPT